MGTSKAEKIIPGRTALTMKTDNSQAKPKMKYLRLATLKKEIVDIFVEKEELRNQNAGFINLGRKLNFTT